MPGTHGAVETRASSKPGWSLSFFFLLGVSGQAGPEAQEIIVPSEHGKFKNSD
jgi:hypothetical protein